MTNEDLDDMLRWLSKSDGIRRARCLLTELPSDIRSIFAATNLPIEVRNRIDAVLKREMGTLQGVLASAQERAELREETNGG
jgi:hypothetical protein